MFIKQRIKVFTMNNPNCTFCWKPNWDLFYNQPIMFNDNVIGFVSEDHYQFEWVGEELFSDIYLYGHMIEDEEYEFKNYCVNVTGFDGNCEDLKIKNVEYVEVKIKE